MKVSELKGDALDYWCRHAEVELPIGCGAFSPSTNWAQGGPIIEREKISIFAGGLADGSGDDAFKALIGAGWDHSEIGSDFCKSGPTVLIAAMRCFVASKFGNEVKE
jgi:hypothetical protein